MDIVQKIGIHNRFDIEVIDANTREVKQRAQAENVITNNLWSYLCNPYSTVKYFQYLYYGSGTGTPSVSDTTLFNHVAAVQFSGTDGYNGCSYSINKTNRVASCKRTIQLSESTAVGVNITEVGVGGGNTNQLATHAMLQDMNGNPISIQKTNTDVININATIYLHWDANTQVDLMTPYQNAYYYGMMMSWLLGTYAYNGNNNGKLPATAMPSKGRYGYYRTDSSGFSTPKEATFSGDVANKKITFTVPRMAVGENNAGGIGMFYLTSGYLSEDWRAEIIWGANTFIMPVEKFWPGSNITNEAAGTGDGVNKRFGVAFDFPKNVKVYINGIEQTSGFTVRCVPCGKVTAPYSYLVKLTEASTLNNEIYTAIGGTRINGNSNQACMWGGVIYKNLMYETGFSSAYGHGNFGANLDLYGTNDLTNWTKIGTFPNGNSTTIALDATTGFFKYYRITGSSYGNSNGYLALTLNSEDYKSIIFDTAPADGDVITVDYTTPWIAKDANHVFDMSYTLQFGDYTPAP